MNNAFRINSKKQNESWPRLIWPTLYMEPPGESSRLMDRYTPERRSCCQTCLILSQSGLGLGLTFSYFTNNVSLFLA